MELVVCGKLRSFVHFEFDNRVVVVVICVMIMMMMRRKRTVHPVVPDVFVEWSDDGLGVVLGWLTVVTVVLVVVECHAYVSIRPVVPPSTRHSTWNIDSMVLIVGRSSSLSLGDDYNTAECDTI